MKNTAFSDFISSRPELKLVGEAACGKMGDFPVFIRLANKVPTINIYLGTQATKDIKKGLMKLMKREAMVTFGVESINITLNGSSHNLPEKYQRVADIVIPFFYENNVAPVDTCPYCGAGSCNIMALTHKGYSYAHESCVSDAVSKELEKVEKNEISGSYILGFIGALIGAVVGALPIMLMLYFMDDIYSIAYILIPLAAYFGYKLFKGKATNGGVAIIILVSVIGALFTDLGTATFILIYDYGYNFKWAMISLLDPSVLAEFIPSMLISLLFVALGIFFVWSKISVTNKSAQKEMAAVTETIMPV